MRNPVTPFAIAYPAPWRIQDREIVDANGDHVNDFDSDDPDEVEFHRGVVEAVNTHAAYTKRRSNISRTSKALMFFVVALWVIAILLGRMLP